MIRDDSETRKRSPLRKLSPLAAVALATVAVSPSAALAQTGSLHSRERAYASRLWARPGNRGVPTANGTLIYTVKSTNPYTGKEQTVKLEEHNPLVAPLGHTALKPDGNNLKPGKVAFGRIDVMAIPSPDPTVHLEPYTTETMRFTPGKHGHQIRWVQFPKGECGPGLPDYGQALQPNGHRYRAGELFGLAAIAGQQPPTCPPTQ